YSPLNADPTGTANLQLYKILGQPPVAFPHPSGSAEVAAFQYINENLCGTSACNVRNQYGNLDIDIGTTYEIPLESMTVGPNGTNCMNPQNAGVAYCVVRAQLLKEFIFVSNIRNFYDNVTSLWDGSGGYSLAQQLGAYQQVLATIPKAPKTAPAPSLGKTLADLFLGLASLIPEVGSVEVGSVFGLADTFFNFGTNLTTDPKGNQTINLTSTIGELDKQAANQYIAQAYTTGTLFEFIYQDWGKMSALGNALASGNPSWSWSSIETAQILQGMGPAIQQAAYRSIMPAAYAIGSYLPQSDDNCAPPANPWNQPVWGQTPLFAQTWSYAVLDYGVPCPAGVTPVIQPFNSDNLYVPYTYPTDTTNLYQNDPRTSTILADYSWLGISALGTPYSGTTSAGEYEPPDSKLLSTLFTPVSQGGLGVYRPAFFESWPFTHITCAPAYGVPSSNGGTYVGGCPWPSPPK
ncbi:MAG: hypothetical protein JOY95_05955, partial [Silvibacterium sp.]|nr:hypothetical protein [Silvibacterium sp.]